MSLRRRWRSWRSGYTTRVAPSPTGVRALHSCRAAQTLPNAVRSQCCARLARLDEYIRRLALLGTAMRCLSTSWTGTLCSGGFDIEAVAHENSEAGTDLDGLRLDPLLCRQRRYRTSGPARLDLVRPVFHMAGSWLDRGGARLYISDSPEGLSTVRRRLNPELLLACTLGTSLLPAISNDYRLSILVGPVAVLLTGTTGGPRAADRGRDGRLWTALTIAALSAAYSATLVPIAFKPENLVLANACPALLLMLAVVPLFLSSISGTSRNRRRMPPRCLQGKAGRHAEIRAIRCCVGHKSAAPRAACYSPAGGATVRIN